MEINITEAVKFIKDIFFSIINYMDNIYIKFGNLSVSLLKFSLSVFIVSLLFSFLLPLLKRESISNFKSDKKVDEKEHKHG